LMGAGMGGAAGYREGGLPGAALGGAAGLIVPEILSSPASQMAGAKMLQKGVPKMASKAIAAPLMRRDSDRQ